MQLDARIQRIAEDLGADFFGVADLAPAHDFITWQGGESLAQYPKAISVGVALLNPIVDQASWKERKGRGDGI
jgi:epoxyqueuosine reductase